MSFWLGALARFLMVVAVAAPAGFLWGWTAALAVVSIAVSALLMLHWRQLHALDAWLRASQQGAVPEATGLWGDVFANLYHLRRAQFRELEKVVASLDRAYQAAGALPEAVVVLDAENRIEWCNAMAHRLFGIEAARDAGTPVTQLVRQPELVAYVGQGDAREPILITLMAGNPRRLSVQVIPFADDGRLLIARDVTVAEKADTVRRDFVANVSHELRTPLTVIIGFMEHLVADEKMEPTTRARFLGMVQEQAQRMNRLVDDLLTLSSLEAVAQPASEEDVDVPTLLRQLVGEGEALSDGKHSFDVDIGPLWVRGNTAELRSAFGNLITNAVRYTPPAGRIGIRWTEEQARGVLAISDSGIGIPSEHLPRLTERFYRVDKGRSTSSGGTGLGLAIVKHVLQHHQAQLDIHSVLGEGSTFRAVFPPSRLLQRGERRPALTRVA